MLDWTSGYSEASGATYECATELWPAWIVWDCWPLRRYHLFTVAGALYVSFTHVRVPSISEDVWLAQGLLILCWTFVATGLADHLLLVHLTQRSTGDPVNQGAH